MTAILTTTPHTNSKRLRFRVDGVDETALRTLASAIDAFTVSCTVSTCDVTPYLSGVVSCRNLWQLQEAVGRCSPEPESHTAACYECGGPVRGSRCTRCGERQILADGDYSEGGGYEIYGGEY